MRLDSSKAKVLQLLPRVFSVWLILCLPLFTVAMADNGGREASSTGTAASNAQPHTILNMVDTDITVLIETISAMTGKTFIIDDNVKGKVNVVSPEKISQEEAYRLFESVLEVKGFALVPSGKALKVVPASEARSKNIETRVKTDQLARTDNPEDKLITQLIHLKYADVKEVKTLFTPLVSKNSVLQPYADTNTLIVADVESNIKRLLHIINAIDVPGIGREVSFIPLAYANADTVTKTLSSVFKTSMSSEKDTSQKTLTFVSDERTNAVIFVASEDDTSRIKKLIHLLDKQAPRGTGSAHVYALSHADAANLVTVLKEIPKADDKGSENANSAAVVSGDVTITADETTNSLIIFADNADYAVIKDIIEQLDIPRAMVYIEAMIMEVSMDDDFELGVEWSVFEDTTVDGDSAIIGGGFNSSNGFSPTDLLYSTGGSVGIISGDLDVTIGDSTVTIPSLGALIKALQSNENIQILSTPKLLTTDNTEASIVVGKKIPYQTRTSTSDNDTYNSYEYQTVGLTLKITPHISEDRNVRLEIYQELSAVSGASTEVTTTPTTRERTVETTVIVKDQNMLVIGGLIDDNQNEKVTKVPLLGSIPILGRLFRYDTKVNAKTNLYIFITPRVVQNPAEARKLTLDVQESMSPVEAGMIKLYAPDHEGLESVEPFTTETSE
jgi:general secretion pathway protein D